MNLSATSLEKEHIPVMLEEVVQICSSLKKNQLIIFDRFAHDLLIDKIRYKFNLSNKLSNRILKLFPEPHLWIVLKAPIKTIEKRKKENRE